MFRSQNKFILEKRYTIEIVRLILKRGQTLTLTLVEVIEKQRLEKEIYSLTKTKKQY